jgi:hypothetical protein
MSKTYTFVSYVEHNLLVEVADIMTVRATRCAGPHRHSGDNAPFDAPAGPGVPMRPPADAWLHH